MRVRLTARKNFRRAESRSDGVFPGDIGNEDRSKNYHDIDEYTNYDFKEGWDTPVQENTWEGEKRDEVGFGIPKTANRFLLAKNSAIMAQCFLGDEASSSALEKQARIFMKLGLANVRASLKRWKATEPVPEEEAPEACKASEECENCEEQVVPQDPNQPAACRADDETPEENFGEIAAGDEAVAPADEDAAPQLQIDIPPAANDDATNMFATEGELNQAEADPELVALLSGDEENKSEEAPVASRAASKKKAKQGIKRLAGQPKLASTNGNFNLKNLEGLWANIKLPGLC